MASKQDQLKKQLIKRLPVELHGLFKENDVFLVGGCIRDLLLDRNPVDYDLVVARNAQRFALDLGKKLGRRMVALGKPEQPLFRVWSPGIVFDVSPIACGTIEADLANRDFSINAMAWSWTSGQLINSKDGLRDLEQRRVSMISPSAFSTDPVRLLRAYRIATELSFTIDARTRAAIRRRASSICQVAGERIRNELVRWLKSPHVYRSLQLLKADNLLEALFPHLCASSRRSHPAEACADDMPSAIDIMGRLERFLIDKDALLPSVNIFYPHLPDPDQYLFLKVAVLYSGLEINAAGKHMTKMRFSNRERSATESYLRGRRHLLALYRQFHHGHLSIESMAEFYTLHHEQAPYLLLCFLAEGTGDHDQPAAHSGYRSVEHFSQVLWEPYRACFGAKLTQPPLISGRELMEAFNLTPSREIGGLLNIIRTAQIAGSVTTPGEALQKARRQLKKWHPQPNDGL